MIRLPKSQAKEVIVATGLPPEKEYKRIRELNNIIKLPNFLEKVKNLVGKAEYSLEKATKQQETLRKDKALIEKVLEEIKSSKLLSLLK